MKDCKRTSKNHIKFCPDHYTEIENYDLALADNFVGWVCHHRNGEEFSKEWLIQNNMYYNRTDPHEFKFVTTAEHKRIHCKYTGLAQKGVKRSDEFKKHVSDALSGRQLSEEHRKHLSESRIGKSSWSKGKQLSPEHRRKLSEARKAFFKE